MKIPEFVTHDVFQTTGISRTQGMHLGGKTFFDKFKWALEPFGHEIPVTLLVVAKDIEKFPEWIKYIKDHKNYTVQCHGWTHKRYTTCSIECMTKDFTKAKEKIERIFNQKVTVFHPPKDAWNNKTIQATKNAGMLMRTETRVPKRFLEGNINPFRIDFHYWNTYDMPSTYKVLSRLFIDRTVFIIGAPRSGTTAYVRWYARKMPNAIVMSEVEGHWRRGQNPFSYYLNRLRAEGKREILDKNARNSLRIKEIAKMFDKVEWIHVIRDGRAVAASWRVHNTRLDRYDKTIDGAAYQWVHFMNYIKKARRERMKAGSDWKEVRYEKMCEDEDFFKSRNYKWQRLGRREKGRMLEIAGDMLRELKYI